MQGQRGVAPLRDAKDEQLAVLPHVQGGQYLVRRREQIDRGRCLRLRVEVAVPWDGRVSEPEVVRADPDEAVAREHGARGRTLEALTVLAERTDDVGIRGCVIERHGR